MAAQAQPMRKTIDLAKIDPSHSARFADGSIYPLMKQLRHQAPIHYCADSPFGPYWSITKHRDIIEIEAVPAIYSSQFGITITDAMQQLEGVVLESFIAMDPPRHTSKRRTVAPAFTPSAMENLSASIRQRTGELLDSLPRNEAFDWVARVSIPLTRDMLAIIFGFPWEERDNLIIWSDAITSLEMIENEPEKRASYLLAMAGAFHKLWEERANAEPGPDLVSTMIHSDALGEMEMPEFLGTLGVLVVGGNDTTRNSMSAIVAGFNEYPDEWQKLLNYESLIPNAASELIRWQAPLAHMRRTVLQDTEFRGHTFKEGEKIVLWYNSANRDETLFEDADRILVDRENARRHLSFGYGVHRCVGARLAELQLQILLSEMRARDLMPELVGKVERAPTPIVSGITALPVRIRA